MAFGQLMPSHYVLIVNGIKSLKPHEGIGQAHVNCVLLAKQHELPYACIMEDDLRLQKGWEAYLDECLQHVPEDWDILLGGVYEGLGAKVNDYWNRVGEFCGLHFYIVNAKAYDKIIEYPGKTHIDRWMNQRGDKLKCYVTKKFFATQSPGLSNNTGKVEDYDHMISRKLLL